MKKHSETTIWLLVSLSLCSCGESSVPSEPVKQSPIIASTPAQTSQSQANIPNNTDSQHYQVLFIGNSHVSTIPFLLEQLVQSTKSEKVLDAQRAPGIRYLIDRVDDGVTYDLLKSQQWSHVILQAQKYSTSGQKDYTTRGSQTWIKRVRDEQQATPILFPEHPQLGNGWEGQYIHDIHVEISQIEPACVAPVGLAWDRAISLYPELPLHSGDGNHAALAGHFLSASIFYQIITGESAELIPFIAEIDISKANQTKQT